MGQFDNAEFMHSLGLPTREELIAENRAAYARLMFRETQRPRDTGIVTFKDWLDARSRTGAPLEFIHFDEVELQ